MSARRAQRIGALLLAAAAMGGLSAAMAQSLEVPRQVIANGGGDSSGGSFSLSGTVGQAEPAPAAVGGSFELRGGFWAGEQSAPPAAIFRDGFEAL